MNKIIMKTILVLVLLIQTQELNAGSKRITPIIQLGKLAVEELATKKPNLPYRSTSAKLNTPSKLTQDEIDKITTPGNKTLLKMPFDEIEELIIRIDETEEGHKWGDYTKEGFIKNLFKHLYSRPGFYRERAELIYKSKIAEEKVELHKEIIDLSKKLNDEKFENFLKTGSIFQLLDKLDEFKYYIIKPDGSSDNLAVMRKKLLEKYLALRARIESSLDDLYDSSFDDHFTIDGEGSFGDRCSKYIIQMHDYENRNRSKDFIRTVYETFYHFLRNSNKLKKLSAKELDDLKTKILFQKDEHQWRKEKSELIEFLRSEWRLRKHQEEISNKTHEGDAKD